MCDTCGCTQPDEAVTFTKPGEGHHHHHDHDHPHDHSHESKTVSVEQDILLQNNLLAERNRGFLNAKNILALNLVSSPGSGKTTLLENSIKELGLPVAVIEGDQQTLNDANRIAATGAPVLQVNTGAGCHLDSQMIETAIAELDLPQDSVLMIENVGNLVCPALFDLGEKSKVVIISVTEGDDKPEKYPTMFSASDLCIINKIDLLPYVNFDVDKCKHHAQHANPDLEFIELSATTGQGMDSWLDWIRAQVKS